MNKARQYGAFRPKKMHMTEIKGCKRKNPDRRESEQGPPNGWKDRRRSTERRLPEVQELAISEEEFFERFFALKETGGGSEQK